MVQSSVFTEDVEFMACNGVSLSGRCYRPEGRARANIIVASATGVPQGFYRRFCEYIAGHGYAVYSFDYRGTGRSRNAPLKGFEAGFLTWAEQDLAGVVDYLSAEDLPVFIVGHSFGGQCLGLIPNHEKVSGFYAFGSGSGWHGWMPCLEAARVLFLWHVFMPVLVGIAGYLPMSWVGMGEDLPLGVYHQWKRWCGYPKYFFDDPEYADEMLEKFAQVKTPLFAANTTDDLWISPAARDAYMWAYTNAPYEAIDIDPAPYGGIGHMGYFRAKAQPLWDDVIRKFDGLL